MSEYSPHPCIEYIYDNAPHYAKAKGELAQLEAYKSSLKSMLMTHSGETSLGAQEREAYAHDEYLQLLMGIRAAVEAEEELRWSLVAAQARVEVWRSQEATNRAEGKSFT